MLCAAKLLSKRCAQKAQSVTRPCISNLIRTQLYVLVVSPNGFYYVSQGRHDRRHRLHRWQSNPGARNMQYRTGLEQQLTPVRRVSWIIAVPNEASRGPLSTVWWHNTFFVLSVHSWTHQRSQCTRPNLWVSGQRTRLASNCFVLALAILMVTVGSHKSCTYTHARTHNNAYFCVCCVKHVGVHGMRGVMWCWLAWLASVIAHQSLRTTRRTDPEHDRPALYNYRANRSTGQQTLAFGSLWFPPLRWRRFDFYGNLRTLNRRGGCYPTPTSVAADEPGNLTINPTPVGVRVPRSFSKVHTRICSRVWARDHIDRSAGLRSVRITYVR